MARHNGDEYRPNSISLEHVMPQSAGDDKEIGMVGNIIPCQKNLMSKLVINHWHKSFLSILNRSLD